MMVEEPLLGETLYSKEMEESLDESEETLSLCDLPLYSKNDQWDDDHEQHYSCSESSMSSSSSSSSQLRDDYFEFFSPSPAMAAHVVPENIIFCGKLIQYKQQLPPPPPPPPPPNSPDQWSATPNKIKKTSFGNWGWGMFGRMMHLGWGKSGSKNKGNKRTTPTHDPNKGNHMSKSYSTKKHGKEHHGHGFAVHKMPILTPSASGRGRWFLFLFGISTKFSTEVDIRDIKNRQSRRGSHRCSPELPSTSLKCPNGDKAGVVDRQSNGGSSGVWGLIRVLSCGGNQSPNTMVLASLRSCSP